jgi:antitoxin ParD1/3/4
MRETSTELINAEFEAIANQLADELITFTGANPPSLSDYAVSRDGIYEEHP